MIRDIWRLYGTPRWWITAGLGTFLLSILVGYHQDQIAADSVLAGKVPLPPLVQAQEFDRSVHSNLLREARLLGEAATRDAIVVDIGSSDVPRLVQVVPVYSVSEESAPMAIWYQRSIYDAVRRPVPRSSAPSIAAEIDALRATERTAIGLLISEGRATDDLNIVGPGVNGPLVSLLGAETGGGNIRTFASAALNERGVMLAEDVPVIALYPAGQRPQAPIHDYSAPRRVLEILALALLAIGLLKLLPPITIGRSTPDDFEEVEAVGDFPSIFEPILTQEEIIRREQDASEKSAAKSRRVMTRAV